MGYEPKARLHEITQMVRVEGMDFIGTIRGIIEHQFDETRYIIEVADSKTGQIAAVVYPEHSIISTDLKAE